MYLLVKMQIDLRMHIHVYMYTYILHCVGDKKTVVKGLVPLKTHQISVIAVYKDGIEQSGHTEHIHTGLSVELHPRSVKLCCYLFIQLELIPCKYLPARQLSLQLCSGSLTKGWRHM